MTVFNANGVLQIDETYANLALIATGQVAASTQVPGYFVFIYYATVTVSALNPLVAVRANYPVALRAVRQSGSQWTFELSVDSKTLDGTPITYYVFDTPPAPPAHGVGLQVFNAAGRCTFDSSFKYMLPAGVIALPGGQPIDMNQNLDLGGLPAGTYAAVLTMDRFAESLNDGELRVDWSSGLQPLPTGVRMRWTPIDQGTSNAEGSYFRYDGRPSSALMLDVSRY
jgi:hypothetical protein